MKPAGYPGLDLQRYIDEKGLEKDQFKIMDIGELIPIQPSL
jgi:hypothetical protein